MPQVSIITPTRNRENFLPALWDCVRAQSVQDFEWLVHDGSATRAAMFDTVDDPRVRYMHGPKGMSIGAKRNVLCDAARGEIIVHFDDDDFYGPHYIQDMISFMTSQNVSFVKLFGFFLFQQAHRILAYWDLDKNFPVHYRLAPNEPPSLLKNADRLKDKWGYGFSYVFHRTVWQAVRFPDRNHGEDREFADAAISRFTSAGKQDSGFSCLHVIHTTNTSAVFPQQVLSSGSLQKLFPGFRG